MALPLTSTYATQACQSTRPTVLIERVMSAACEDCWKAPSSPVPKNTMVLDWIAPASESAALQAAALSEATSRVDGLSTSATSIRVSKLETHRLYQLTVKDGPAWNGYIALQMRLQTANKRAAQILANSTGYLALIERIPAEGEGTAAVRQLVRVVLGPLTLAELASRKSVTHLRSVRLPENAQPERLVAVGWIENLQGAIIAASEARATACQPER